MWVCLRNKHTSSLLGMSPVFLFSCCHHFFGREYARTFFLTCHFQIYVILNLALDPVHYNKICLQDLVLRCGKPDFFLPEPAFFHPYESVHPVSITNNFIMLTDG